jgi:uncharacterized membrane protein YeiB
MPRVGGFEAGRVFGPDLARGIALLGMFAAHVAFEGPEHVYDGRSAILFATVAGVSLGLLTGGAQRAPRELRNGMRAAIALRALALIVIGVLLTELVRPPLAVILDYYGFAFLLLIPLLFAPRWVLAVVAGGVALVAPPVVLWLRDHTEQSDIPVALQSFASWAVYGVYPMAIWLVFPIAGLIVARSDLARRRTQLIVIASCVVAAIAGYGAAALVPGVTAEAHSGTLAEVLGSGGVAVAIIGAATLLGDLAGGAGRRIRIALYPVAAAGGMALSIYTAHAIALALVRDAVSGGADRWTYPHATLPVLIVATLLVATLWRVFQGAGPIERLLRLLTRLARPPRV